MASGSKMKGYHQGVGRLKEPMEADRLKHPMEDGCGSYLGGVPTCPDPNTIEAYALQVLDTLRASYEVLASCEGRISGSGEESGQGCGPSAAQPPIMHTLSECLKLAERNNELAKTIRSHLS